MFPQNVRNLVFQPAKIWGGEKAIHAGKELLSYPCQYAPKCTHEIVHIQLEFEQQPHLLLWDSILYVELTLELGLQLPNEQKS